MTSRERVEACFKKEKTDKLPVHHMGLSSKVASFILGRESFVGGGVQQWREMKSLWEGWHEEFLERSFNDAMAVVDILEQDIVRTAYWRWREKPSNRIDEYTYEFAGKDCHFVMKYNPLTEQIQRVDILKKEKTLKDLKKELKDAERIVANNPITEDINETLEISLRARERYRDEKIIRIPAGGIGIPVSEPIWLEAIILDPGIVKEYIRLQVERGKKSIEFFSKYGFKYFFGGGDFASSKGPLYSPKHFKEIVLPGLKELTETAHKWGGYYLFASDGNLWPVADELFRESGIDGYYEIDRRAGMDLKILRERFPELTLLGNISSWTLSRGTKEEVKEEIISCCEMAKKYKGIVVGASNYLLPDTPAENIEVFVSTLKEARCS